MRLHLTVLLRLVVRIEQLAREHRDIPREFAQVATQGRHLTLWVLQYLRDVNGLAAAVEIFEAAKIRDVDVRLARGALEELRAVPDAVAQSARSREPSDTFARDNVLAREERRLVEIAARVYEALLVDHPAVLEAHLRLARLELRLGRAERAEAHLVRVAGLKPDARQAYLAALFLADVYERQGRIADAIAAYGVAQQNWPGAQTPGIGLARLRALSGAHQEARAALAGLHLERAGGRPGAIRSLDGIHRRAGLAPALGHRRAAGELRGRAVIRALLALPLAVAVTVTVRRAAVPRQRRRRPHRSARPGQGPTGRGARRGRLHGHRQRRGADDHRPRPRPPADRRRDRARREQQRPRRAARAPRARRAGTLVGLLTPQDRATLVTFDHQVTLGPRDVRPHALDARLAAIVAGGRTSLDRRGDDGAGVGRRPRAADAHPRLQRRARHGELDAHRSGAGARAVERRRRRRGRHRRAAADEHGTHRFRRHARRADAGRAVPRRSGRADRRTRPQRRGRRRPRRRVPRRARAVPRPLRDHLHRDQQGAGLARDRRARAAGAAPASTRGADISGDGRSSNAATRRRVPGRRGVTVHARRGYQR